MKNYNIQTVSQLCGVSTHCIRAWEKRYGAIRPVRSENGRRLYSEAEVNRLLMLVKLSSFGNSIGLIARLPDEELRALVAKMGQSPVHAVETKALVDPKIYLSNMLMALNSYKLEILTHELNKASMDLSCRQFALDVVAALIRKVGVEVQAGRMSIAQEHTLSAIMKFFIGRRIAQHYRRELPQKPKFLLATPVGEEHYLGILLASLLMADKNINFVYMGENLPEESIADAVKATGADTVLLSISPAYQKNTQGINPVLQQLRKLLPETSIWVGGSVEQVHPRTQKDLNVGLYAHLAQLDEKLDSMGTV